MSGVESDRLLPVRPALARGFTAIALGVALLCRSAAGTAAASTPQFETRVFRNVAYGPDPRQRFDVFAPANATNAPVILMVHGGGWFRGDKRAPGVVDAKRARWVPRGFVVISTNYRMLPDADPLAQAQDVARALAFAQGRASQWGGDRTKFILMGHSAGAHLAALVATSPATREGLTLTPWLGVVSLESGALDVVEIMRRRHERLYDRAFGKDTAFWRAVSPTHTLTDSAPPMLLVCSARRGSSCRQADDFAAKARSSGTRAEVLRENLTHAEADGLLGRDSAYTANVEAFLRTLDPEVARRLP